MLIKFNKYYINSKSVKYTISEMINIWVERFNNIKNSCFKYLDSLDVNYNDINTSTSFSFGLANNAISYLADTKLDYGDNIERLTLTHIRLNSLDSYSFLNPKRNYRDIIILVIDKSELSRETDKVYPSVGIVGDFNNDFVTSKPNKKTTHSKITLNYECDTASKGVLIYFEYIDDAKTCISYIDVSVN